MTPRERVIAAIDFAGPDRIPHRHQVLPAAFGVHPGLADLLVEYPSDFAAEDRKPDDELQQTHRAGEYTDAWGCTWTVLKEGFSGQVTRHPLADLSRLSGYTFPDPLDDPAVERARQWQKQRGDRYLCLGTKTLFEHMISLCGFDALLMELGAGNPLILELRDRIVDYNITVTREFLRLDPDGVYFADDWGTQQELIISPSMWRELFLPAYRQQFEPVRAAGKHVFFHTDGFTIEILPDLVDAGVNVFWADLCLNGLDRLRRELGGRVCFQALTDVQFIAPLGSAEEARQHGRDIVAALGSYDGGMIGCHEVNVDQPWHNVVALFEAFCEEGGYPLRWRWDGSRAVAV